MRLPTFYELFLIPNWGIIKYKCAEEFHFYVIFPAKKFYYQWLFVPLRHENPPSLSTMLKCAGRFCFYGYMATRIPFIKTYSTPHELVQLLKTRGMEITDEEKAQHYLSHIGYCRLSAYMYPLLSIPKEQHLFKQGVTFGKVMMLYRFDKKLRLLLSQIGH